MGTSCASMFGPLRQQPQMSLRQNLQVYLQQQHSPNYAAHLWVCVGFLLEPRLEDVLRPEASESDLGWKLYRLLGNATCVCRS